MAARAMAALVADDDPPAPRQPAARAACAQRSLQTLIQCAEALGHARGRAHRRLDSGGKAGMAHQRMFPRIWMEEYGGSFNTLISMEGKSGAKGGRGGWVAGRVEAYK